ncbi:hypothetical protein D187_007757 [Cystobacter fuscus DSM 2262]|uniref:Uncharacterized protein n=1 Tax=Cystobacter fuscus (strain ATCC 25194 / DSM 2262 / NBRC 100088 / M29) TaxID=1242864 RepID=S9NW22_CYSF2|nr:hypothetical protein D187_007757 [Cystobacter fuscus DSM 2262]
MRSQHGRRPLAAETGSHHPEMQVEQGHSAAWSAAEKETGLLPLPPTFAVRSQCPTHLPERDTNSPCST